MFAFKASYLSMSARIAGNNSRGMNTMAPSEESQYDSSSSASSLSEISS